MKTNLYHGDTFTHNGQSFRVQFEHDSDRTPWEDDGRGKVRKSNYAHTSDNSDKKPGERPLNDAGRNEYQFYYDWSDACKQAKKDGWNTAPYDAPNRVQRAVEADFECIRAFLNDDWNYVGVIVARLDSDGEETGESESLWGVESYKDYHVEVAYELAEELIDADTDSRATVEVFYAGL